MIYAMSPTVHEKVADIAKAFHGHVFGKHVRYEVMGEQGDVIDVRLDGTSFQALYNVLNLHYDLQILTVTQSHVSVVINPTTEHITLNVYMLSLDQMMALPVVFDADAIVSCLHAMYVRPLFSAPHFTAHSRLYDMTRRMRGKRFALVAPVSAVPNPDHFEANIMAMIDAEAMVQKGWVMDDYYIRNMSWLLNRWSVYENEITTIRRAHSAKERGAFSEQTVCYLCHERFQPSDVVLNTCCNHNFHWKCQPMGMEGILYWFQLKQEFGCPCCRRPAAVVPVSSAPSHPPPTTMWWNIDVDALFNQAQTQAPTQTHTQTQTQTQTHPNQNQNQLQQLDHSPTIATLFVRAPRSQGSSTGSTANHRGHPNSNSNSNQRHATQNTQQPTHHPRVPRPPL
jgi:hypothetical protein